MSLLARASAAAADADGVRSALANALHDALAADQVLMFEVAQGGASGAARAMRGDAEGYHQALGDGAASGTARVVRTGAPLLHADADFQALARHTALTSHPASLS